MAILPLSDVSDLLPIARVIWDIEEQTERSGTGSGAGWEAELAPDFWVGEVFFDTGFNQDLKEIAALLRWVRATGQTFLLCDPLSLYPAADPQGAILGNANVTLRAITNRYVAPLQGLPPGYVLTPGDKMQIPYFAKHAFVEVARRVVVNAGGQADVAISPYLPLPIVAGLPVILKKPACPVCIPPKGHNPGTAGQFLTDGAGMKVEEKKT